MEQINLAHVLIIFFPPKSLLYFNSLDDCEEVEQLTKEVIQTVEKICGETLQF